MNTDVLAALTGALIAGAFGAAAVVYTGNQSSDVADRQVDVQRQDVAQQERATRSVAVGGSRLLQVEYNRRFDDVDSTLARVRAGGQAPGSFPHEPVSFASALSADDRRRVAAALSTSDWTVVAAADLRLDRAERLFARRLGEPVSAHDRTTLCDYASRFAHAIVALGALSGDHQQLRTARKCP